VSEPSAVAVDRPGEGVVLVALSGEHDLATRDSVHGAIHEALAAGHAVVVDLTETEFMDSVVAAVLVEARRTAKRSGLGLGLVFSADDANQVRRMFEHSELTQVFAVYPTRDAAVEAVRAGFAETA
jgi:anti-anti-sigma factor